MAILVEEEKKRINWVGIIGVFIIVVLVGTAIIYLFFVNPEKIDVFISPKLQSLSDFSQIEFNPEELVDNPVFKNLKSYTQFNVPQPGSPLIGKSNPLMP
ncbi:hypothetical protein COV23_00220 [Candidatus Wolfebacteria bacterium CG10_big_fil_rev_8_21_14_0_10_31_9]|uniref:Uncharacterized protein n=1 Tax=Candidatus Wolfebacteria bacterium CG10_big_fil_rev_8_21_14_0_10_31_9 TaxID=1975070 RepID=A0A2H0REY7_9BACT|nr:MAG: hypothetical protein COV23_00220 [Candidatus Wolfebacteria bacterium CG10_big_fil_rev_8_21_14_0_10_31_9]